MVTKNNDSKQPEKNTQEGFAEVNNAKSEKKSSKYKIPVDDIKAMINKYKTERQEIINGNLTLRSTNGNQFSDTRSVWFSIDELKSFISEVENENPANKLNGLRMYFVVYPPKQNGESSYLSVVPEDIRNQTSLVLIPTYYDSTNKLTTDFPPETAQNFSKGKQIDPRPSAQTTLAMNHGALCPPGCPPPSSGVKATYLDY